ncbi:hypothetical protein BC830DRAFT_1135352 [Chytriomyces sp. MP71]|nr:hypothetical protein BC830DRAFT_1135352 [Chytriomyces sp. MP71]
MGELATSLNVFLYLWSLFWFLSMLVFLMRRKFKLIASRQVNLSLIQSFANLCAVILIHIDSQSMAIPCFVELWMVNLAAPTWMGCVVIRSLFLFVQFRTHQRKLMAPVRKEKVASTGIVCQDEFGFPIQDDIANIPVNSNDEEMRHDKDAGREQGNEPKNGLRADMFDKWIAESTVSRTLSWTLIMFYSVLIIYLAIAQVHCRCSRLIRPLNVVQVVTTRYAINPMEFSPCGLNGYEYAFSITTFLIVFIFGGVFTTWLVKDIKDHDFISRELLWTFSLTLPLAFAFLIFKIIPSLQGVWKNPNWLLIMILILSHCTSIVMPAIMSYVEEYRTNHVLVELSLPSFYTVYEDRTMFEDLKQFAIQDMCGENIFFLEALDFLKQGSRLHYSRVQDHEMKTLQPKNCLLASINLSVAKLAVSHRSNSGSHADDLNLDAGSATNVPSSTLKLPVPPALNTSNPSVGILNPLGTPSSTVTSNEPSCSAIVEIGSPLVSIDSLKFIQRASTISNRARESVHPPAFQHKISILRESRARDSTSHRKGSNPTISSLRDSTAIGHAIRENRKGAMGLAKASVVTMPSATTTSFSNLKRAGSMRTDSHGNSIKSEADEMKPMREAAGRILKSQGNLVPLRAPDPSNPVFCVGSPHESTDASFSSGSHTSSLQVSDALEDRAHGAQGPSWRKSQGSILQKSQASLGRELRRGNTSCMGLELPRTSQVSLNGFDTHRVRKSQGTIGTRKSVVSIAGAPDQAIKSSTISLRPSAGRKSILDLSRTSHTKWRKMTPAEECALDQKPVPKHLLVQYNQVYELYCTERGSLEVNLSASTRQQLKEVVKTQDWKVGDFNRAREEVANIIFSNVYCRWVIHRHQNSEKARK